MSLVFEWLGFTSPLEVLGTMEKFQVFNIRIESNSNADDVTIRVTVGDHAFVLGLAALTNCNPNIVSVYKTWGGSNWERGWHVVKFAGVNIGVVYIDVQDVFGP